MFLLYFAIVVHIERNTSNSMKILNGISPMIVLAMVSFFITACRKNEPAKMPIVSTTPVIYITTTTALSGGSITSSGGAEITSYGVCWGVSINPSTSDSITIDESSSTLFVSLLTGLNPGTVYHIRAYATNSAGTAYGADIIFSTLGQSPASITLPATNMSVTGVTLNGMVNANELSTTVIFEYGPTTSYGSSSTAAQSPVTGNTIINVSTDITGLTSGSTYHFRIKSINSIGTTYSNDMSFSTIHAATSLPIISTTSVSGITGTTALSGGTITDDGGGDIIEKGVCWSIKANPEVGDFRTSNGSGIADFMSSIKGLSVYTNYYLRAYATNSLGTSYGNQITFITLFTDLDGNLYNAVTIGTQIWMKENLKTTVLNDSTTIPQITDNHTWGSLPVSAYCWYNNDASANKTLYGALYNWYAVHTGKLCPTGWHVSTDSDWKTLEMFLGMSQEEANSTGNRGYYQGVQLKSKTGWIDLFVADIGTDNVGFSALPAGLRGGTDGGGMFVSLGCIGAWWVPEEFDDSKAWFLQMDSFSNGIYRYFNQIKKSGLSVRCVK